MIAPKQVKSWAPKSWIPLHSSLQPYAKSFYKFVTYYIIEHNYNIDTWTFRRSWKILEKNTFDFSTTNNPLKKVALMVKNCMERFNLAIENMARFKYSWTVPCGLCQRFNLAIENMARFKCSWTVLRGSCQRFNLAFENMVRFKYVQEGSKKITTNYWRHLLLYFHYFVFLLLRLCDFSLIYFLFWFIYSVWIPNSPNWYCLLFWQQLCSTNALVDTHFQPCCPC